MTDYTELLELLRYCSSQSGCIGCKLSEAYDCTADLTRDAAAAIEALQAQLPKRGEIVRCVECKYWSEVDTSDGLRYGQCDHPHSAIRGNCFIRESWFCADGEREVQE